MQAPGWLSSSMLAFALLQAQAGDEAATQGSRYERLIRLSGVGATCALLDAAVFAHASPSLKDLRLRSGGREIPFAIAVNGAAQAGEDSASVLNLRQDARGAEFDLAMPSREYTQLVLRLDGRDFVAMATVAGGNEPGPTFRPPLGTSAVFDLTSRGLSRNTTISLQEGNYPFLHVSLRGSGFRVRGAETPPSREERTLFTTVAETTDLSPRGTETIARFRIPARVPVERVAVALAPEFTGNFSRNLRVIATTDSAAGTKEEVTGTILRVKTGAIQVERESVPASLGANLQADATVEVAILNEAKSSLPIRSVALAMRQRTICFDAPGPTLLLYGDPSLAAPVYRYQPSSPSRSASLEPERLNPSFRSRSEPRGWAGRHPWRSWSLPVAFLLMGMLVLGLRGQQKARALGGPERLP